MSLSKAIISFAALSLLVVSSAGCGLFKKNRAVESADGDRNSGTYSSAPRYGSSTTQSTTSGPRTAPIILNEGGGVRSTGPGGVSGAGTGTGSGIGTSGAGGAGTHGAGGVVTTDVMNDRTLSGVDRGDLSQFADPANPLSKRIVYFAYDSDAIRPEYRAVVEAHARYLREHPNVKVRLEGHADERGTREYNIALGERRAKSVLQAMSFGGASLAQMSTLSYGEERPIVRGSGTESWAQNRRVELVYYR